MKNIPNRIMLPEDRIPEQWLNLAAVMPEKHDPYLHPGTLKPATREDMRPIFADECVAQELNDTDEYIDIPGGVLDYYKMYRPSPLIRAYQLEKALDTPARIYYKYEGNNTSGSHKLNSAIPQVYYNKEQGFTNLTTETGAGQWGTALSQACAFYNMPLSVYMVKISTQQKPYRKAIMETFGANVIPSPSDTTKAGRDILARDPECAGSLGIAIGEAIEVALETPGARYVLGSVMNQVLLHQSIIGLESKLQMEMADEYPDIVIACAGGGSNLGGLIAPFMRDTIKDGKKTRFIAVEPTACPTLTRGRYAYDFCDTSFMTPLARMYTLGSGFLPSGIHAGGLRYHGMSPILSKLYHDGLLDEAVALPQTRVFEAALTFAKCEALLPAPESAHAICAAMDEAKKCRESGEAKTILFGLSGHGNFDLAAYSNYLSGKVVDYSPSDEELAQGFATLPKVD